MLEKQKGNASVASWGYCNDLKTAGRTQQETQVRLIRMPLLISKMGGGKEPRSCKSPLRQRRDVKGTENALPSDSLLPRINDHLH